MCWSSPSTWLVALALPGAAACTSFAGLDDLEFGGVGGASSLTNTAATGGAGAAGGGGAGSGGMGSGGAGDAECPTTWMTAPNGHRYCHFSNATLEWAGAKVACEALGAEYHLATLVDVDDVTFVDAMLVPSEAVYIGASDQVTEGSFEWVTGEPWTWPNTPGFPWYSGANEPNGGTASNCVRINDLAEFYDTDCTLLRTYVCEHSPAGS